METHLILGRGRLNDQLTLGEGDHAVTRREVPGVALEKPPSILGNRLGFEVGGLLSHAFFRPGALTIDFTLDESGFAGAAGGELSVEEVAAAQQRAIESGSYPNLVAVAPAAEAIGPDDTFEAGLAALMAGLRPRTG